MAAHMGLNETVAEQVSIVVTEACTNLLKHAGRGEIILHSSSEGLETTPLLDVLALDQGPGMRNLQQSLEDGYSTGQHWPAMAWARSSACLRIPISTLFRKKALVSWPAGGRSLPNHRRRATPHCGSVP